MDQQPASSPEALNMSIWNNVCTTPARFTQSYRKGGFNGTAMKPQYAYEMATRTFGPAGLGWKVKIVDSQIFTPPNDPLSAVHYVRIELSWKKGVQQGVVEAYGSTSIWQRRKEGDPVVVEDFAKMSQTDATLKALSYLGFGADLHYGLHEEAAYRNSTPDASCASVEQVRKSVSEKERVREKESPQEGGDSQKPEYKARRAKAFQVIAAEVKRMNSNREAVNKFCVNRWGRELAELKMEELRELHADFKKMKSIPA
jgi:hypothetical protein